MQGPMQGLLQAVEEFGTRDASKYEKASTPRDRMKSQRKVRIGAALST
jgi:hypothetical protein